MYSYVPVCYLYVLVCTCMLLVCTRVYSCGVLFTILLNLLIVVKPSVEQAEQPVNLGRELTRKASEGREQKDVPLTP